MVVSWICRLTERSLSSNVRKPSARDFAYSILKRTLSTRSIAFAYTRGGSVVVRRAGGPWRVVDHRERGLPLTLLVTPVINRHMQMERRQLGARIEDNNGRITHHSE